MAQPLRSLPPQIKNAPLVVPTRRVKFVRVEVIKASLPHPDNNSALYNWYLLALGHKRTFGIVQSMSALPPKADIGFAISALPLVGRKNPFARSSDHENIAGKIEPPGEKLRNVMAASKSSASIVRPTAKRRQSIPDRKCVILSERCA
jgi:hypothetical protein